MLLHVSAGYGRSVIAFVFVVWTECYYISSVGSGVLLHFARGVWAECYCIFLGSVGGVLLHFSREYGRSVITILQRGAGCYCILLEGGGRSVIAFF